MSKYQVGKKTKESAPLECESLSGSSVHVVVIVTQMKHHRNKSKGKKFGQQLK